MTGSNPTRNDAPSTNPAKHERVVWHHIVWKTVLGLVLIAVVLAGTIYFTAEDHAPEGSQAAAPAQAVPVGVITLEARDVPVVPQFLAQTEPSELVQIRARVNGFLVERGFQDGDTVEKGQVLFRIDPEPFEVALRRAEAGLKASEAQLVRAEQQVKRFQELAQVQQAAANELEQAQESLRIAAASVETRRTEIEQAKLDLGYATVRSPITGVIDERRQDVGSYVGPGAEALLVTVRKTDPLYVRYSVSERDLLRWQRMTAEGFFNDIAVEDLVVEVILPDERVFPHKGSIDYVDVAVDPSTGTALVRATVPNPDLILRPGQFVHVQISGVDRLNAVVVPQRSVLQTPGGAMVYVVDDQSVAQMRPVELGDWAGDDWIIESGLEPGERIIVDHLMQVRPGMKVEPTEISALETTEPTIDTSADEARGS